MCVEFEYSLRERCLQCGTEAAPEVVEYKYRKVKHTLESKLYKSNT